MRVTVTGASGFVGAAACAALVAAGHEVTGYGRRPRPDGLVDEVHYRQWDLTAGALAGAGEADAVLHCAAAVDDWAPITQQRRVTVDGTAAALATWPRARFVHVSSASVYPAWRDGVVTEADGPASRFVGPYPRAKAEAEHVVASAADRGWRTLVLRPHAVYGASDPTLLPRLQSAVRGRGHGRRGVLVLPGSRHTAVHLTSVTFLAEVCRIACESDVLGTLNVADAAPLQLGAAVDAALTAANGSAPHRLHLARPAARSLATVLEGAARAAHRTEPPVLTPYVVSHLAVSRVLDLTRLRSELGVVPPPTDLSVLHAGRSRAVRPLVRSLGGQLPAIRP